ncbi:MAG: PKD domain-containing protein [Candidatus Diapherotrites archaeon]
MNTLFNKEILLGALLIFLISFSSADGLDIPTTPTPLCENSAIHITAPINNSAVSGIVEIKTNYSGSCVPNEVEFSYTNSSGHTTKIGTDVLAPFSFDWDTSGLNGLFTIKATASYDNSIIIKSDEIQVNIANTISPIIPITIIKTIPNHEETVQANDFQIIIFYESESPLNGSQTEFTLVNNGTPFDLSSTFSEDLVNKTVSYQATGLSDGTYYATIKLQNQNGQTDITNWNFELIAPGTTQNNPPIFNDGSVFSGGALTHPSSGRIELTEHIFDEAMSTLTYLIKQEFAINCELDGSTLLYQTADGTNGNAYCIVTITDNLNQSTEGKIEFTINEFTVDLTANPTPGAIPLLIIFTAIPANGTEPYSFQWDFDGDGSFDRISTNSTINHIYSEIGTYTPKVKVTDSTGKEIIDTIVIEVLNLPNNNPVILRIDVSPTEIDESTIVLFNALVNDADNDELTYEWSFGDGTTGTGNPVEHSFDISSQVYPEELFTVQLIVTDEHGATKSKTTIVNVRRAELNITIQKPISNQNQRLSKNSNTEIALWVTDKKGALISGNSLSKLTAKIANQEVKLFRQIDGTYKGTYNPNHLTPSETTIRVETIAIVGNAKLTATTLKSVYYQPIEINAEYRLTPKKIRIGELITGLALELTYPTGEKVKDAIITATLDASTSKTLNYTETAPGEYFFSEINYLVQQGDELIKFTISGTDSSANFFEKIIEIPIEEINPLFNVQVIEPDPVNPIVFNYGNEHLVIVQVNSTKKDLLKNVSVFLENQEINLNAKMHLNELNGNYEAIAKIPKKNNFELDSLKFSINGRGFIEGEEFNSNTVFSVALTEAFDLTPLILVITVLFVLGGLGYVLKSIIKEKGQLKKGLELEKTNLAGLQTRLKHEYLQRHISEQEFKERYLRTQQELTTVDELLGAKKAKHIEKLSQNNKLVKMTQTERDELAKKISKEVKEKMKKLYNETSEQK